MKSVILIDFLSIFKIILSLTTRLIPSIKVSIEQKIFEQENETGKSLIVFLELEVW